MVPLNDFLPGSGWKLGVTGWQGLLPRRDGLDLRLSGVRSCCGYQTIKLTCCLVWIAVTAKEPHHIYKTTRFYFYSYVWLFILPKYNSCNGADNTEYSMAQLNLHHYDYGVLNTDLVRTDQSSTLLKRSTADTSTLDDGILSTLSV